ncbi:MAG: FAD-dependent monooxygenase, partial [Deltaproteobacteria bacterium]
LACALARHGVACRVVEQGAAPSRLSRASGVHARTLEVLEALGCAEDLIARGRRLYGTNVYAGAERLVHVSFDDLDSPYPFVLMVPQHDTEMVLEARARALGVRIDRGVRLDAFTQDALGADVVLAGVDGTHESARVGWLVGCDGAESAVRKALGVGFAGDASEEHFALADVHIDWNVPSDEGHVYFAPDGMLAAFPMPGEDRWRLMAANVEDELDAGAFAALLESRSLHAATVSDPTWTTTFSVQRRLATSYRVGRAFVAGDAAHIHSPIGGQGMNTGIQDAFNLAWKLALVVRGEGRRGLLDSYELERRPIAALTIEGTDLATRVVTLRSALAREIRDLAAMYLTSLEAVQSRMVATAAETAVHYRGSPIVDEFRTSVARSRFLADRSTERPSMADWVEFSEAPAPGERARDALLATGERLFEYVHGPHHMLLLFDGAAATAEGYRGFVAIARAVRMRCGERVMIRMVVPSAERPAALPDDGTVWLDPGGALHRRYGAGSECLFLFRPDGYVAFRSQPAHGDALMRYLDGVLT